MGIASSGGEVIETINVFITRGPGRGAFRQVRIMAAYFITYLMGGCGWVSGCGVEWVDLGGGVVVGWGGWRGVWGGVECLFLT